MKKIAIVIGHKPTSKGAYNKELNIWEYDLNKQEAYKLANILDERGIPNIIIHRKTYKQLPAKINAHKPDYIISLHHNSFDENSTGTEVLYYHRSKTGKKMAEIILDKVVNTLGYKNRGIKPCTTEDRGGYLLKYTKAPCVIVEPCFMSNTQELQDFLSKQDEYVYALADAIEEIIA